MERGSLNTWAIRIDGHPRTKLTILTEKDPILREARTRLLAIFGDEKLVDQVMSIVRRAKRQTEIAERVPQWREGGEVFY